MALGIASTNEEMVVVTVNPVTAQGRPAPLDGAITVTVVSGEATVVQDPLTPNSFTARSGDAPGTTEYLVSGDADLGEGVVTIQDTVIYEVSGANAAALGLSAAPPIPKI